MAGQVLPVSEKSAGPTSERALIPLGKPVVLVMVMFWEMLSPSTCTPKLTALGLTESTDPVPAGTPVPESPRAMVGLPVIGKLSAPEMGPVVVGANWTCTEQLAPFAS